jgi:hypothetical protein
LSAKWRRKKAPAAAEPVNSRPSISSLISAWPVSRPPLDEIDDSGRHARRLQRLDQHLTGQRRLFRRLEHHRVAGQQGRHDVAVGQVTREVERPQHRHHAMGAVAQHGAAERHVILVPPVRSS